MEGAKSNQPDSCVVIFVHSVLGFMFFDSLFSWDQCLSCVEKMLSYKMIILKNSRCFMSNLSEIRVE